MIKYSFPLAFSMCTLAWGMLEFPQVCMLLLLPLPLSMPGSQSAYRQTRHCTSAEDAWLQLALSVARLPCTSSIQTAVRFGRAGRNSLL